MKKYLGLTLALVALFVFNTNTIQASSKNEKKVCEIKAEIDCQSCANKIKKNIAFEKGVKEIKVDVPSKTVTITYLSDKNTPKKLAEAITKLGYKAKVIDKKDCPVKKSCSSSCGGH